MIFGHDMDKDREKNRWTLLEQTTINRYKRQAEELYKGTNQRTYGWLSVFVRAYIRFGKNHGAESAAAIAFFSIFSVVPLIIFIIAALSAFISSSIVQESARNFLATAFPVSLEGLMDIIIQRLAPSNSLNWIATLGLLWAASNMFYLLLLSLKRSWNSKEKGNIVENRLLAIAFVTALAVVVMVVFILLIFIRLVIGLIPKLEDSLLVTSLPALVQVSLIFLLYKFGPSATVNTKAVLLGAFIASLAIEITTRGFTWYLNSGRSTYSLLYGPLGAIIGLLFWVYLCCWILLYGSYLAEAVHARWSSDNPREFFEAYDFGL